LLGIEGAAWGYLTACSFNTIIPFAYARKKWTLDLKPLIIPNLSFALIIIAAIALTGLDRFDERLIAAVCFVPIYVAINYQKIRTTLTAIRNR
jgi:Na+-driven multidrug efflux pump